MFCGWKLGPALAAGNTVVMKPSELVPLSTLRLCELFEEAGIPSGVVNVVPGYGSRAGAHLAAHADVGKLSFTGSTRTGRSIVEASAGNLKRLQLELGAKAQISSLTTPTLTLRSTDRPSQSSITKVRPASRDPGSSYRTASTTSSSNDSSHWPRRSNSASPWPPTPRWDRSPRRSTEIASSITSPSRWTKGANSLRAAQRQLIPTSSTATTSCRRSCVPIPRRVSARRRFSGHS